MQPQTFRVVKVTEQATIGANNRFVPVLRVEFLVGDHGPFVETFPKEQFQPHEVNRRLQQFADGINGILPREL